MALFNGPAGDDNYAGTGDNDSILGNNGNDTLGGADGNDTMKGGAGNDWMTGGSGADYMQGQDGNDRIDGGTGKDTMTGDAGNDTLIGGEDADLMSGGAGSDTYYVDNVLDEVYETDTTLGDIIYSSVSYTLPIRVEALTLTGSANINATGSLEKNTLTGNDGNNVLDGGDGADLLVGGLGNDTLKGGTGLGRDTLTGGDGVDVFKVRTLNETTNSATTADLVTDFVSGTDKVDISMIDGNTTLAGYQAFTFIGTAAFTAPGQVRFDTATQTLQGNTAGTSGAEMMIKLQGATSVSLSDLILIDSVAPVITTNPTVSLAENSGANQVVFKAAIDEGTATYSLVDGQVNRFTLTASTGYITLNPNPNFENKESYTVTLRATDPAGNKTDQVLTVYIRNIDEVSPTVTSLGTGNADENQNVLYTATADDSADISAGVMWSITGTDAALLTINSSTGVVTRKVGNLDYETKATYSFNVVASDGVTTPTTKAVTVSVTNLDEVAPNFESGATGSVNENVDTGTTVYTAVTNDNGDLDSGDPVYSLKDTLDGASFSIDPSSGAVKTATALDQETKATYTVVVVATDPAGNAREKTVTITVNDLDEVAPNFTSGATGSIDENAGEDQLVYTAASTDTGDISTGSTTYSLKEGVGDEAMFSIDEETGEVTLNPDPDHETDASYTFTVVATDAAGNMREKEVTITVNDLDEIAPDITSATTDEAEENQATLYTAVADDSDDISAGVTWSLTGEDAGVLDISSTGVVTLKTGTLNYEGKQTYSFNVVADDGVNTPTSQGVTISVTNVDEVAPNFESGSTGSVNENASTGTVVYTAQSNDTGDLDSGAPNYTLKDTLDGASFVIDAETGVVSTNSAIDHETKDSYSIVVIATDPAGNAREQAVTITVNDLDEEPPEITSLATANIDENVGEDQVVYTATATDGEDISGGVTFSLDESGDWTHFTIDEDTGEVKLLDNPDFETKPSYTFTVVATDAAGHEDTQEVTLSVNDVTEVGPAFTSGSTADAIDENVGTGQEIYTATTSGTGVTFAIKPGEGDDEFVSIDEETGVVTLLPDPDHEDKSSYTFTVQATDGTGTSEKVVTLQINDLDEVDPVFSSGATADAIDENTGEDTVIYDADATDPTDDGPSDPVTYSLQASGDWASFDIDEETGEVTLLVSPDADTKDSYTFTVIATDDPGNSETQEVTLAINDVDDAPPEITSGGTADIDEVPDYEVSFLAVGHVVYTAVADDSDDVSDGVTFSLAETGDWDDFLIDEDTGVVTLLGDPDHETKSSYTFTVVATDGAGLTDSQTVTLTVNDLDEVAPTITSGEDAGSVNENDGQGDVVYTAEATDTGDVSDGVTFSLDASGDGAAFDIDEDTGEVTLLADADHENKSSYTFTVIATDGAGLTDSKTVTLAVTDIDESQPTITSLASGSADENQNVLYDASATDTDDVSAGITWSITGTDAGLLTIDPSTGVVTKTTGNLDEETKASYSFNVVASDGVTTPASLGVTITVTDIDESQPTITSLATGSADENENVLYDANATDTDDVSAGITWSITGTDAGLLTIDPSTGVVTKTTGNLDQETKASYSFNVVASDGVTTPASLGVTITVTDIDESQPTITSLATGSADENQNVLYDANATDTDDVSAGITWSITGTDAGLLTIDPSTGVVTKTSGNLDYETKSSYSFNVVASDGVTTPASLGVTVTVNDLPENPPSFTSGSTASAINENSGSGQMVYDANATSDTTITFSLKNVDDYLSFSIDGSTGQVTLTGDPNAEAKNSYSFTVIATNAAGATEKAVTLAINDVNEFTPTITTGPVFSNTGLMFTAADADVTGTLSFMSPYGAFGSVNDGTSTTFSVSEQGSVLSGELGVSDGTNSVNVGAYVVVGSSAGNSISSSGSNPSGLWGFGGDDTLLGGAAADRLVGGAGNDSMNGGGNADVYDIGTTASGESDTITGFGDGADSLVGTLSSGSQLYVNLHTGGVAFSAAASGLTVSGNLFITGQGGNDSMTGGAGNDTIAGNAGADVIDLSAGGSDTLMFSTAGLNGIDSISSFKFGALASGGDVFNFAAVGTLGGTGFASQALNTAVAASVIALTNDALGASVTDDLNGSNRYDQANLGNRIVIWEIDATSVGVALINSSDTTNNENVSVTQIATLTGFANQTAVDAFTAGLTAANFILS